MGPRCPPPPPVAHYSGSWTRSSSTVSGAGRYIPGTLAHFSGCLGECPRLSYISVCFPQSSSIFVDSGQVLVETNSGLGIEVPPLPPVAHYSSSWTRSSSAVSESERNFSGTLAGRSIRGCSLYVPSWGGRFGPKTAIFGQKWPFLAKIGENEGPRRVIGQKKLVRPRKNPRST